MLQVEMVHMPKKSRMEGAPRNELLPLEWLFQIGSQFQGMQERTCQKVSPRPAPYPTTATPLPEVTAVTGGSVSALASKITTTITLLSPISSKFHLQPIFFPLLLPPSCSLEGYVQFVENQHAYPCDVYTILHVCYT